MKLYENIVIGNFLYALGFCIRSKSHLDVQPGIINLLQQSPADTLLGDLLVEFQGTTKLIEFKQISNKSKKEREKHRKIRGAIVGSEALEEISRDIHWFVETSPVNDSFTSRIVPYLDAYPEEETMFEFPEFVEHIADRAVDENNQFSEDQLKKYLDVIKNLNGPDDIGTGGLLVHIDKKGNIRYMELVDMTQLRLTHKLYLSEMKLWYEKKYSLNKELSLNKGKSLGFSMGL
ncbi:hypothetical protein [Pleionea sp. CnH1-48]|uniref:hypothetical protein n=1 Tax=Pleionea sp. CnH1-48 TaxID=2954494 RepID=UPI0020971443|nr:hypothetical protein [Pleionea sp. CnH1-48]MCO7226636.1 hypothetical protein [Pleionea sp. CnH1-48]